MHRYRCGLLFSCVPTIALGLCLALLALPDAASQDVVGKTKADGVSVVTKTKDKRDREVREDPRLWWKNPRGGRTSSDRTKGGDAKATPAYVAPGPGLTRSAEAYPTGDLSTSVILIEKMYPGEVIVGEAYDYTIKVSNLTDRTLKNVVLKDSIPAGFKTQSISPKPDSMQGEVGQWLLGDLGAKGSKTITMKGAATGVGTLEHCATVTCEIPSCMKINVVQPGLKLVQSATPEVLVCDLITIKYNVTNPGTGPAGDTKITAQLPAGLATIDGKTSVLLDAGTLGPGQSREFTALAKASKTGEYTTKSKATASPKLSADSNLSKTVVRQPVLAIEQTCRDKIFLGRNVSSDITVTNKGDAASANTVLEATVPAGTTLASATDGGALVTDKVVWNLGTIQPKASKKVTMMLGVRAISTVLIRSSVKGTCAEMVADSCETKVMGIPAILLEVVDLSDPVEVGGQETYVITATNQGTATDTNIKIVVTLEDVVSYVTSTGDTVGTAKGATVEFAPLASLAPKAAATWKVVVKALKAGDSRFKVSMTTGQLTRPVEETEATNLYQ